MKSNNIIAIGMEYVGIATGSMFGVDLDEIKINTHKLGYPLIYENGVEVLNNKMTREQAIKLKNAYC